MDQEKIGKFILNLRKKNNLTQSKFAKSLGVTSQAVSKWENGRGIPDIELMIVISEVYKIDISELLNQKKQKRKQIKSIVAIILFIVLITITCTIYFYYEKNKGYQYTTLSSSNTSFNVKGVAVYTKEKKSIYISSIEYLEEEVDSNEYTFIESHLYETHNGIDIKISQCEDVCHGGERKKLSEFLKTVEFNIDNYSSTCKILTSHNLYILIIAKDFNGKTNNYKIPITLDEDCTN